MTWRSRLGTAALAAVPLAVLGAFFLYPVLQILWLSLVDQAGRFTFANFGRALTTPVYARTLGITLKISAWTTVFSLLAGYPVAYLLATAPSIASAYGALGRDTEPGSSE